MLDPIGKSDQIRVAVHTAQYMSETTPESAMASQQHVLWTMIFLGRFIMSDYFHVVVLAHGMRTNIPLPYTVGASVGGTMIVGLAPQGVINIEIVGIFIQEETVVTPVDIDMLSLPLVGTQNSGGLMTDGAFHGAQMTDMVAIVILQ